MTTVSDGSTAMLAAARQRAIVDQVQRHSIVRITDLSERFGVSNMTIRRDIDVLVDEGSLEKIHGGAKLPGRLSQDEPGFEKKSVLEEAEKRAIAVEAAKLVAPGMAIGLSAGTTTFALAKQLRNIAGLTIVTNSILVADLFHQRSVQNVARTGNVILTGGERTPSDALVGPIAVSSLHQLHLDVLFLGIHGADEWAGLTTPNMLEAETNRAFISAARRLVVLADNTKWGMVGISTTAQLDAVDVFITDNKLDLQARAILGEHVGRLIIAAA